MVAIEGAGIDEGLNKESNQPKDNTLEVNFNWGKIELKGDNKLTKDELKAIESLVTGDREKILEQTKSNLNGLKNEITTDLKNRLNRKENGYIRDLLNRTEKLLDSKISENKSKEEKASIVGTVKDTLGNIVEKGQELVDKAKELIIPKQKDQEKSENGKNSEAESKMERGTPK